MPTAPTLNPLATRVYGLRIEVAGIPCTNQISNLIEPSAVNTLSSCQKVILLDYSSHVLHNV